MIQLGSHADPAEIQIRYFFTRIYLVNHLFQKFVTNIYSPLFKFSDCKCRIENTINGANDCDFNTGQCNNCKYNYAGLKCDKCANGYYGFPNCYGK